MHRIWIIEDNPDFRSATARGLQSSSLECDVTEFSCCEDAIASIEPSEPPSVILMDIGLPGIDGIAGIGEIKNRVPECSILILTVFEDDDKIFRALKAGASGYLLKSESIVKVNEAIELVLEGAAPINPRIASRVLAMFAEQPPAKPDYGLTEREKSVLDCMTRGLVRKQTAIELDLNIHTVDYVMRRIYKKLHVNGATEAVALAVRDGLL
jgi:DNA-binding NarL/FixJ family response regulator